MAVHWLESKAIPLAPQDTDTSLPVGCFLGQQAVASDGATYELVLAAEAISQYQGVVVTYAGAASKLTTTNAGAIPQKVGIAQNAIASGAYGWVVRKGPCTVKVLASCAKDVKLYTTATAGSIDDTATTQIFGLVITANDGGSGSNIAGMAVSELTVNS